MFKQQYLFLPFLILFSINTWAGSILISKGTGFSDATVATPIGGNTGVTIGQQRTIVFDYAASLWTTILGPNANITINASFAALPCDASSAIFASTAVTSFGRNFSGAINALTWYPQALQSNLTSIDGTAGSITANINIGNIGCFNNWYYGLDHNPPNNDHDLLNIVMHEIAHNMGFITFVNLSTGEKQTGNNECTAGCDDIYMTFLRDNSLNKNWPNMTNEERKNSAKNGIGGLVWSGNQVQHIKSVLSGGLTNGYPRLYAPSTLIVGSSVAHWNTNVTYTSAKNELMEHIPKLPFDMALTIAVMRDIGWSGASYDYDKDDTNDETDAFPNKIEADADTDNDGMIDNWTSASGCSGATCGGFTLDGDDDGDGVQDIVDENSLDNTNTNEVNLPLNNAYNGLQYRLFISK